jgi:protein-disulfide isomerase
MWFALTGILALTGIPQAHAGGRLAPLLVADTKTALALTPDDRIFGKPDAPITIVEYGSLNCPHCAHFALDVLPKLKQKWIDSGKAKLVFRDFPLNEEALQAAVIARCAPPDRFYAFVDTFMKAQPGWVSAPDFIDKLTRLAKLGGLSQKQVTDCLNDKALGDKIAASRLIADQDLGVDSTPTFFINGTKFSGDPSEAAFDQALSNLSPKS